MIWRTCLCILICISFTPKDDLKVYQVKKVSTEFNINGKGDHEIWNHAGLLTDFQLPWDDVIAQPTTFRALWSDQYYYFFYEVADLDIVAPGEGRNQKNVLPSDRIEIFFKSNGQMNPYYCLEMDPKGRILDYISRFYRDSDFSWSWPKGHLDVQATIKKDGYLVEGKISLSSLRDLGILADDQTMDAGLFRGDYYHKNKYKTAVRWISWVIPKAEEPDFHIPSAFGKLELIE